MRRGRQRLGSPWRERALETVVKVQWQGDMERGVAPERIWCWFHVREGVFGCGRESLWALAPLSS